MISDWILNLKLLLNLLYVGYLDFKITITGHQDTKLLQTRPDEIMLILVLYMNTQHREILSKDCKTTAYANSS